MRRDCLLHRLQGFQLIGTDGVQYTHYNPIRLIPIEKIVDKRSKLGGKSEILSCLNTLLSFPQPLVPGVRGNHFFLIINQPLMSMFSNSH